MKKIWTKALAYVMAVTMCFSAVNVPAYAQEGTVTEASTEAVTTNEAVTEEATVSEMMQNQQQRMLWLQRKQQQMEMMVVHGIR